MSLRDVVSSHLYPTHASRDLIVRLPEPLHNKYVRRVEGFGFVYTRCHCSDMVKFELTFLSLASFSAALP